MNLNHSISIVKFIKIGITRINSHDKTSYNNQIKKKKYKRYYFSINILQYHVHNRRIISTTKWSILDSLNREEGRKFESLGCWRDSTWKRRRWRAEERWSSFLFIIRGGALVSFLFDKGRVIFHCYWRRRGMCGITCSYEVCPG